MISTHFILKLVSILNKVLKEDAYKKTTIIPPKNITTTE